MEKMTKKEVREVWKVVIGSIGYSDLKEKEKLIEFLKEEKKG
jgi:hypothetical protein